MTRKPTLHDGVWRDRGIFLSKALGGPKEAARGLSEAPEAARPVHPGTVGIRPPPEHAHFALHWVRVDGLDRSSIWMRGVWTTGVPDKFLSPLEAEARGWIYVRMFTDEEYWDWYEVSEMKKSNRLILGAPSSMRGTGHVWDDHGMGEEKGKRPR